MTMPACLTLFGVRLILSVSCLERRCSKSSELAMLMLPLLEVPVRRTVASTVAAVAELARPVPVANDDDEVERRPGGGPEDGCDCTADCCLRR